MTTRIAITAVVLLASLPTAHDPRMCAAMEGGVAGNTENNTKQEPRRTQKIRLQYRIALDAIAPSGFLAYNPKGELVTAPRIIDWELPKLDGQERESQTARKKEFDDLLKRLEKEGVNGAEFECDGWEQPFGVKLRLTSIPQLTQEWKRRLYPQSKKDTD